MTGFTGKYKKKRKKLLLYNTISKNTMVYVATGVLKLNTHETSNQNAKNKK